jgi:hypothetical protein
MFLAFFFLGEEEGFLTAFFFLEEVDETLLSSKISASSGASMGSTLIRIETSQTAKLVAYIL